MSGCDGLQQLGLEQQLAQAEPVHGVALHHLHDRGREVGADVAEPPRHPRSAAAQPGAPLAVVELAQRLVAFGVVGAQPDVERRSPAPARCRRPPRRRGPAASGGAGRASLRRSRRSSPSSSATRRTAGAARSAVELRVLRDRRGPGGVPVAAAGSPSWRRSAASKREKVRRSSGSRSSNVDSATSPPSRRRPRAARRRAAAARRRRRGSRRATPRPRRAPCRRDRRRVSRRATSSLASGPTSSSSRLTRPATGPCTPSSAATPSQRLAPRPQARRVDQAEAALGGVDRGAHRAAASSSSEAHPGRRPTEARAITVSSTSAPARCRPRGRRRSGGSGPAARPWPAVRRRRAGGPSALGQRGDHVGQRVGQVGQEALLDEGPKRRELVGLAGPLGDAVRWPRRAPWCRKPGLDQGDRELRLPAAGPAFLERAAGAAARRPVRPKGRRAGAAGGAGSPGALGLGAQVEHDGLLARRRLEPQRPLLPGEVAGQRHHRRVVGHRAQLPRRRRAAGARAAAARSEPPHSTAWVASVELGRAPRRAAAQRGQGVGQPDGLDDGGAVRPRAARRAARGRPWSASSTPRGRAGPAGRGPR